MDLTGPVSASTKGATPLRGAEAPTEAPWRTVSVRPDHDVMWARVASTDEFLNRVFRLGGYHRADARRHLRRSSYARLVAARSGGWKLQLLRLGIPVTLVFPYENDEPEPGRSDGPTLNQAAALLFAAHKAYGRQFPRLDFTTCRNGAIGCDRQPLPGGGWRQVYFLRVDSVDGTRAQSFALAWNGRHDEPGFEVLTVEEYEQATGAAAPDRHRC